MENKKRSISTKTFAILLAVMLIIGCMAGGTIAWLISTPDAVVNTFTYGDINIELFEHAYNATNNTLNMEKEVRKVDNYKIIPGVNLPKDPTVRVKAGSEACYLFVKVEATNDFVAKKVTYTVDTTAQTGWTKGDGTKIPANVYYRAVPAATADATYTVLQNGITVSEELTKEDIKNIMTKPTLTFTAYAVQQAEIATAEDAWAKVPQATPAP